MQNQDFTNERHWQLLVSVLKNIANQKGKTNSEIAEITGYHRSTIGRIFDLEFCPKLQIFIDIARAVGVNFYFEDQNEAGTTDLNKAFEQAMTDLGRRPDRLPKN